MSSSTFTLMMICTIWFHRKTKVTSANARASRHSSTEPPQPRRGPRSDIIIEDRPRHGERESRRIRTDCVQDQCTRSHHNGRLACHANHLRAGIDLSVCTKSTEPALALLTQDRYPGKVYTEQSPNPGYTIYDLSFSRTDLDTPDFLSAIADCIPLIT